MKDDLAALAAFDGVARLFPLPNVVFFPHVLLPLHIFEPRYRQMTADALAGDRLIAMALLQPGWEEDYEGRPGIHPTACLGSIVADHALEDGRFNLMLRGLCRVRIREEIPHDTLYRNARVEVIPDAAALDGPSERLLRQGLESHVLAWNALEQARAQLRQLFERDLPLGVLCDVLSFALPFDLDQKIRLLSEANVELRTRVLFDYLQAQSATRPTIMGNSHDFPPSFSPN